MVEQQPPVGGLLPREAHAPRHGCGYGPVGIRQRERPQEPLLEALDRSQPGPGEQLIARAEAVVEGAAGGAAARRDRADAHLAGAGVDHQVAGGVEHRVDLVKNRPGHAPVIAQTL